MDFNKKKKNLYIPIAIIFSVLYIIFSFKPDNPEVHFTPEWTRDIVKENPSSAAAETALIPFSLGQNIGFFTPEGSIVTEVSFPFKAAITDSYYAPYNSNALSTDFFTADGTKAGTIDKAGFPFFQEDRIYVMLPGGTAFSKHDTSSGKTLWSYEHYSPITAFSSSEKATVAGFADGTVVSVLNDGKVDQKFSPGGSEYEVILGTDISRDGTTIACVSGQDEQRFLIAQKTEGLSKIVFHEYIQDPVIRQTLVKFSPDSNVVYFDTDKYLGIHRIPSSRTVRIPMEGIVSQVEFMEDENLTFVLCKENNTYTVTALESYIYPLASFSFEGDVAFIQVKNNSLYVGHNTKISKLVVERN